MRVGMHYLLGLLRGDAGPGEIPKAEWMTLLDLAEEENILPWVADRLTALGSTTLPHVSARLHEIERKAQISAFLWGATLKTTLAAFHDRGIPVISLKGPWLAERLYGDAALKLYADLDLLVRREDIALAEDLLSGLGFVARRRRDDYARPWRHEEFTIDLHHDVENPHAFDFGIERVWKRAQRVTFQGVPAHLLCPSDELLFLCLHSTRHRFERLSHVLDLVLAFRQFDAAAAQSCASGSPFARVLALGAMMSVRFDPCIVIPEVVFGRARMRAALEDLADQLWRERMLKPAAALDWRSQHRFYLMLETGCRDRMRVRMRHLRILLTRLIEADFAFAAKLHIHRTWQVWLLRPIRLLLRVARLSPAPP